jgi:MFS-type transporter involved in bile tolerance (Atg22 family)
LYVFSLLFGYANTGVRILRVSYLFAHVPNQMIGRLLSFFKVADTLMRSLFIALFALPWFHLGNNVRWGYLIFGIFILLCGLFILTTLKTLSAASEDAS